LVGIAGGFPLDGLQAGNVVFSDTIYGYEYGKLEAKVFEPRHNLVYRSDLGLFTSASSLASKTHVWANQLELPDGTPARALPGYIASGDKVVDDPDVEFFKQVRESWPKLHAVEMEGVGAATAIEQAQAMGQSVGFLMIRGISDMPRTEEVSDATRTSGAESSKIGGTKERDTWKRPAADAAAAFSLTLISNGLPTPPNAAQYKELRKHRD
jgi:nucleoside phosphorylase